MIRPLCRKKTNKGRVMKYCPKCRYEYELEAMICSDCNETLVAQLPPLEEDSDEGEDKYKDWVAMVRLTSSQMAEMVLESLRQKDIPAVLNSGAGYFGVTGQMGLSSALPAGGGFTLMVPSEHLTDAVEEVKIILGDDWASTKLIEIKHN